MKVGGHLSIAGGHALALQRAKDIGANALQIFAGSPQLWNLPTITDDQVENFVKQKAALDIDPIYFHAPYLINMADPAFIGEKSKKRIIDELQLAEEMGIRGTIIHLGSYKETDKTAPVSKEKYQILLKNITTVLEKASSHSFFIIEDAGNRKIGWSFDEIARIVSDLKDNRLKVCIDTCHMFAAGYDISTKSSFQQFFSEFDRMIGIERLEVFQVNDSKDTLGSFRDRHENIGEGNIPSSAFELLVNEKQTKDIPFILEVPGVDKKGPNEESIKKLRSFLHA